MRCRNRNGSDRTHEPCSSGRESAPFGGMVRADSRRMPRFRDSMRAIFNSANSHPVRAANTRTSCTGRCVCRSKNPEGGDSSCAAGIPPASGGRNDAGETLRQFNATQYARCVTRWFYPSGKCHTTHAFFRPPAPEMRQNVAHGVSRGTSVTIPQAPEGRQ